MWEKFKKLFKNYGYYALAGVLIVAIALTVSLTAKSDVVQKNPDDSVDVDTKPIAMGLPLANCSIIKGYSDEDLQLNKTMAQWEAHIAIDLASENKDVFSILAGTVENIEETYELGTMITIRHDKGIKSVYASLANKPSVKMGDKVKKGQKLGEISTTSANEFLDGEHLHFELYKDNEPVNPANFIQFENK
ncbi:MAG: M23 family metallopeptidase [Clostridia bacterium]